MGIDAEPLLEPRPFGAHHRQDGAGKESDREPATVGHSSEAKPSSKTADTPLMNSPVLALPYLALWAALLRALLVRAAILPATCARCGLRFERQHLGEHVCSCGR